MSPGMRHPHRRLGEDLAACGQHFRPVTANELFECSRVVAGADNDPEGLRPYRHRGGKPNRRTEGGRSSDQGIEMPSQGPYMIAHNTL